MIIIMLCVISFVVGFLVGRQSVSREFVSMIREIPDALRRDMEKGKSLEDVILETEKGIAEL